MEKKWFYIGNMGCLAIGDQIDLLKEHCTQTGPEDPKKFESVPFHVLRNMIERAKIEVKIEDNAEDIKKKRKRRTKAEMEAEKAGK